MTFTELSAVELGEPEKLLMFAFFPSSEASVACVHRTTEAQNSR